jgi:hypothetical protein
MRTLDRAEYLQTRIEDLEVSAAVEPESNGHPYKEQQERARQQQQTRLQVRDLQLERTHTLKEAWQAWHERRMFLRRQVRIFERLAQEHRAELQKLYAQKPPLLPAPGE